MYSKDLIHFALDIGEVMLKNGAETYRVEDSINRILNTSGNPGVESFVTPTGIFASMDGKDREHFTYLRRIDTRSIHLYRIEQANKLSRRFCKGEIGLSDASKELGAINDDVLYKPPFILIAVSIAASLFAIVFGGSFNDALVALLAGVALGLFQQLTAGRGITQFFIDLIGGFILATTAILLFHYGGIGNHLDIILTSAIMPLVPGVAITNAIRDTLHGHLVTGATRILDAFIIAASIATGVGIALSLFHQITGGLLL